MWNRFETAPERYRRQTSSSWHIASRLAKKVKVSIYIAHFKALRHGSHSVTCNYTNACLYLVSVHQMATPQTELVDI